MARVQRPTVGIVGASMGSPPPHAAAQYVGALLARTGCHVLTGGGHGLVGQACESFVAGPPEHRGVCIAILPRVVYDLAGSPVHVPRRPHPAIEVPIHTHLQGTTVPPPPDDDLRSRNHVLALAPDLLIALPGGSGTLSEIRLASIVGTPVAAFGWDDEQALDTSMPGLCVAGSEAALDDWLRAGLASGS